LLLIVQTILQYKVSLLNYSTSSRVLLLFNFDETFFLHVTCIKLSKVRLVGGHQPSYAEVARAAGKPGVPLGKGKELQAFEPMGNAQYASEAGFADRGSATSPFRVAEGNARGSTSASFPFDASDTDEAAQGGKSDKIGLFWVWKVKLEQLKGEVEQALQCV
jgi:hypothetical protein